MIDKQCELCGTTFSSVPCKKRRFCGKSCSSKWSRQRGYASGKKPDRKQNGQLRPCEVCGAEVYVKPWQEKIGQGRFCSVPCYNAWQARNSSSRPCEWCGEEMQLRPSVSNIRRFCSRRCQTEGRRKAVLALIHNGRRAKIDSRGYILVWEPDHPNAYEGWIFQHRLVMEQHLGRRLEPVEHVHHLDGDKTNNEIDNLVVLGASDHQKITNREMVARRRAALAELEEYRKRFGPLD